MRLHLEAEHCCGCRSDKISIMLLAQEPQIVLAGQQLSCQSRNGESLQIIVIRSLSTFMSFVLWYRQKLYILFCSRRICWDKLHSITRMLNIFSSVFFFLFFENPLKKKRPKKPNIYTHNSSNFTIER